MPTQKQPLNHKNHKNKKGKKIFEFKLNLTPKNFFLWSIILLIIFFIFFSARDISNLFPEKTLTNLIGDIKSNRVKKIEVIGDKLLATYNDGKIYSYQHKTCICHFGFSPCQCPSYFKSATSLLEKNIS